MGAVGKVRRSYCLSQNAGPSPAKPGPTRWVGVTFGRRGQILEKLWLTRCGDLIPAERDGLTQSLSAPSRGWCGHSPAKSFPRGFPRLHTSFVIVHTKKLLVQNTHGGVSTNLTFTGLTQNLGQL